jgi:hypothetical protein
MPTVNHLALSLTSTPEPLLYYIYGHFLRGSTHKWREYARRILARILIENRERGEVRVLERSWSVGASSTLYLGECNLALSNIRILSSNSGLPNYWAIVPTFICLRVPLSLSSSLVLLAWVLCFNADWRSDRLVYMWYLTLDCLGFARKPTDSCGSQHVVTALSTYSTTWEQLVLYDLGVAVQAPLLIPFWSLPHLGTQSRQCC